MSGTTEIGNSLLLELIQDLGEVKAQNALILQEQGRSAEERKEMSGEVKALNIQLVKMEGMAETVKGMKPIVDDYQNSKSKAIGAVLAVSGLASGLGFFASEIKSWFVGR